MSLQQRKNTDPLQFIRKTLPKLFDKNAFENVNSEIKSTQLQSHQIINPFSKGMTSPNSDRKTKLAIVPLSLLILVSCSHEMMKEKGKAKFEHGIIPQEGHSLQGKLSVSSKERGKYLYQNHCLSCHGPSGLGDGPDAKDLLIKPANLKSLVNETPNFKFFISISQWQGDMPGWKVHFNEADREDLVAYLKTFRSKTK